MKAIPYSEILKAVWYAMGWTTRADAPGEPNPDTDGWHSARIAINRAIRQAWNETFWPDLTITEQRQFKADFDAATTYSAGDVVFYPPTGGYYQALRSTTGNAPAVITGGVFNTNTAYWSDAARKLTAEVYSATKQYAVGSQVYSATAYTFHQAFETPPIGTDPSNVSYWGQITELNPVIPYTKAGLNPIGRIAGVYRDNPLAFRAAREIAWDESNVGIQIRTSQVTAPWVKYLRRPPEYRGDVWDATKTYEAVTEEDAVVITDLVGSTTANLNTYLEFSTVADLLAYDSTRYRTAATHNYEAGDSIEGLWIKTTEPGLVDNGDSIRQTADGAMVRRWQIDVT